MKKSLLRILAAALIAAPVAVPVALVAMTFVGALASCAKGDEPASDPSTRAMTHEDSVAAGLIISVENNGEWDGEKEYEF